MPDLFARTQPRPATVVAGSWPTSRQAALIVGILALLFYVLTLSPSLVWGDGGRLQTDAITGGSLYWHFDELSEVETDGLIFERLGIAAWDHPLWVMLGHGLTSLRIAEPGYLLNMLSAIPAAVAVALLFLVVDSLTRSRVGAALGVLSLAVAHTYWFHAVTTEVYALHAFFMALLLWLTLRWVRSPRPGLLMALAFAAGLGMANHLMLVLTIAPIVIFLLANSDRRASLRAQLSGGRLLGGFALFIIGLAPWWVQFVRMTNVAGFQTTATIAAGFPWLGVRWPGPLADIPESLVIYLAFLTFQFTPIGLMLGGYGMVRLWRDNRVLAPLFFGLFAVHLMFSANYGVGDQYAFHLPSYLPFAVFVGIGLADLLSRFGSLARPLLRIAITAVLVVVLPVVIYASLPNALEAAGVSDVDVGIPIIGVDKRDGISYYLNPNQRGDRSAEQFGRGALQSLPANALVLTAWPLDLEPYIAMRHYQLTEHLRTDVTLELMLFTPLPLHEKVLAVTAKQRGCRPLYLASLNPEAYPLEALQEDFRLNRDTHLYRLDPRAERTADCTPHRPGEGTLDDLVESVRQ